MADLKTKLNKASVKGFLDKVKNKKRREDALAVLEIMKKVSNEEPRMWGSSIVGFGTYHYVYESGREGDWPIIGFSPRAQNLTLYIMPGFEKFPDLMSRLGKYKTGKSCLYISKLEDVDSKVLRQLMKESIAYMKKKYKS
ncbi:MAG: DUF1801 domain-containing protein [Cyclobacteriaceae bacterium]